MEVDSVVDVKCAECRKTIKVERNKIENVLQFKGKYYHSECFKALASKRVASGRGKPEMWNAALDKMSSLEAETKSKLEHRFYSDELNEWLLNHYDISVIPGRFFQIVAGLESGTYKGKRCKPISIGTLLECWKWGQKKLDEIKQYNNVNHKGPDNDNARLMYDLAILIGKMSNYLAYKAKQEATARELVQNANYQDVDMSRIGQKKQEKKEDISDIFDDLYVE